MNSPKKKPPNRHPQSKKPMTAVCREKWWALLLERRHLPKPCVPSVMASGEVGLELFYIR
jgi:hypothetical protein